MLTALTIGSPVAVFASFMMPDIFAGLAILAFGNLIAFHRRLRTPVMFFWFALLLAAQLFHSSITVIVACLCFASLGAAVVFKARISIRTLLTVAATVAAALAGEAAFSVSVKVATGSSPVRPPFVTARLVADGPGLEYLKANCPQAPFYLCRFMPTMPTHSDNFLWAPTRPDGLFSAVSEHEKRLIGAEQGRFIAAVLADRPLDVIMSATGSMGEQIKKFGLMEFNYAASGQATAFDRKLPPDLAQSTKRTMAYLGAMPLDLMEALIIIGLLVAIVSVPIACTRTLPEARMLGLLLLLGIIVNAAVCGMLSTPHERYQMRVIWLIPLFAALVWASLPVRQSRVLFPKQNRKNTHCA
jgi:multisubunit Na+/H+ antiporter MnhE subunit